MFFYLFNEKIEEKINISDLGNLDYISDIEDDEDDIMKFNKNMRYELKKKNSNTNKSFLNEEYNWYCLDFYHKENEDYNSIVSRFYKFEI